MHTPHIKKVLTYTVIIITLLGFAFPFYWMVCTAFKSMGNIYVLPPQWIPNPVRVRNFIDVLPLFPFFLYLKNTIYACTLSAIGIIICSSLAAYAFARLKWWGRDIFFTISISTMMLPFLVFAIPWYLLYSRLGLLGSLAPLWLPYWFQHPFMIFLLVQFFREIPDTLSDAAYIDGCSEFGIYLRVILPLSKPILITVFLLHFIAIWNNAFLPLMYLSKNELFTLSLGLINLLGGASSVSWILIMAASVLSCTPLIILFLIFRKFILKGIAFSGGKG